MLLTKYFFRNIQCVILFLIFELSKATEDVPTEIEYVPSPTLINEVFVAFMAFELFEKKNINFVAYKADNTTGPLIAETVKFDHMKKVAFFTHGFRTDYLNDSVLFKDAIFEGTNDYDCVVLVDWRRGTYSNSSLFSLYRNYETAANVNVPIVGESLAEFIDQHITNKFTYVHLMGHSLGAQISGIAARTVTKNNPSRVINRISAMDPAGPIFEYGFNFYFGQVFTINTLHTLRKTDAKFVDVIHASTVLGMEKEAGHVDTYMEESDCWTPICTHSKAVDVFRASINKCSQMTCPNGKLTNDNKCEYNSYKEVSSLGILTDMYDGIGKYIARFYTQGWFGWKTSTNECTALLDLKMKAKDRICPSSLSSKCVRKPYLTMCEGEQKLCKILKTEPGVGLTWV